MHHRMLWTSAIAILLAAPGCTWETARRSVFSSLYSAYGDGYRGDRMSDFDQRYEDQSKAAAQYYGQRELEHRD